MQQMQLVQVHRVPLHQHLVQAHLQVQRLPVHLVQAQVHRVPLHPHLVQVHQQVQRLQARLVHLQAHLQQIVQQQ